MFSIYQSSAKVAINIITIFFIFHFFYSCENLFARMLVLQLMPLSQEKFPVSRRVAKFVAINLLTTIVLHSKLSKRKKVGAILWMKM